MPEPLTLIDNTIVVTQGELTESSAPADTFPFRRINFDLARKPFTAFTNGPIDASFMLQTLNPTPTASSSKITHQNQQSVGQSASGRYSGKKRDASELENGLDQELSFATFRRIGAGLENLGNTCFLNSVLQCLTYTEPLAAYLQSGKHQVTCRKSGFCALCAIQKHVSRALQLSGRSLAPKDLVSNLRCISRNFRNSRQEDAHEYMVNLLESMHKCCLPNGVPSGSQSAYDNSLVHRIFGGRLRSQVKCMQCNYCSNKFDPFLDLSLEILKADSLYKAFANFTAKEQLDGGAKQYECQQCKQKVKALKQLTVYKAPNVLTVHLKRFGYYMSGQKIDKKVHFCSTLELKPFVTGPYDGDLKYTLYGVLVHAGSSSHSGHYYCFVRTSSGLWYALDDNRVYQVSEKKVFEQKAYMLFYFKDRKNFPSRKATDVAHQKAKIVKSGTPNGSGEREAQIRTGLSNGSVNAQTPLQKTADVAHQKEKIVMNRTLNGPNAPKEAQVNAGLTNGSLDAHMSLASLVSFVAPKETQTNTVLSNGSLRKSLVSVGNGLSNEQKPSTVGIERNGCGLMAPQVTQTNSNSSNQSLPSQMSSDIDETMMKGHITGAPEQTQTKEAAVPKRISEPTKTTEQQPGLLNMEGSMEKKGYTGKPRKRAKNFLKCKLLSMKLSSNVLMRTSLNQRKKKKHKRNKRIKNLAQESLTSEGPSSSVIIEAQELVKPVVDSEFKERADIGGAVLGSQSNSGESNEMERCRRSSIDVVRRWDEDESAPSQITEEERNDLTIGYTGDEWDEEYDRGKRKKARISRTEFVGKNSFQNTANERLKSHSEKQSLISRRPPMMMMKKKNKHFRKSRSGNGPFRI